MKIKNLRGFTLIELLVAVSIFSVVVLAIYSTFSVGITARERGEKASDLYQEARMILDRMATEMRNTAKYSSYGFFGKPQSVSFPTLLNKRDHLEICYVTYHLETSRKDHPKILKRTQRAPFGGTDQTTDMSSSAAEIGFSYGYRSAKERSYQWSDSWDSDLEESCPLVVRISLTLAQDTGQEVSFTKTVHLPIYDVLEESEP